MNFKTIRNDAPASVVVFLVALPLCLGIALASNAPLLAGIVSGIVGGIVAGYFSGSNLAVSGPAAGLTVIVIAAIDQLGGFAAFATAVVIAGAIQFALGAARAGVVAHFFPASVIKGMLAAIGIILILKQIPHAFGWDADPEGDLAFAQPDGENTFTELLNLSDHISVGAIIISVVGLFLLWFWQRPFMTRIKALKLFPGALACVLSGAALNALFGLVAPEFQLGADHLVGLPITDGLEELWGQLIRPDWSVIASQDVWIVGVTIAIVASLETLLCIEATDKLDPAKHITPTNQELRAQGIGNAVAGLLGGLPMTAVIVRSSANIAAGAQSKVSSIMHGMLLLLTVAFIPHVLNMIPLSSLAAVLIMVGLKLTRPSLYRVQWKAGLDQFIPFIITILAILFTDLLKGIITGIIVGLLFVVKTNFQRSISVTPSDANHFLIRLRKDVSFLNKAALRTELGRIPDGAFVIIDGTPAGFIDRDIIETIEDFVGSASLRNITVDVKRTRSSKNAYFRDVESPGPGSSASAKTDLDKAAA